MRTSFILLAVLHLVASFGGAASNATATPQASVEASTYLGQTAPGRTPEIFGPGLVSLPNEYEFGSVFSEDGLEFYWGVDLGPRSEIRFVTVVDGQWSEPAVVVGDEDWSYNDPFLSIDEKRLYFITNRLADFPKPLERDGGQEQHKNERHDIWFVEREASGWSGPKPVGPTINRPESDEFYISFTSDGSLFFASNRHTTQQDRSNFDLYRAPVAADDFGAAEVLTGGINTKAYEADGFVSPDGSYLIFGSTRRSGLGKGDLYISFRAEDGSWPNARSLGEAINTPGHELCPFVTRDGKFLFFTSNQDIYWVDASVIESLRPSPIRERAEPAPGE